MYRFGPVQQKLLLIFLGGIALGASYSSSQYFRTLKGIAREWRKIDQRNFNRSVRVLCATKLLKEVQSRNGTFRLILTEEGKRQARRWSIFGRSLAFRKPKTWDRKWRLVMFDIPERKRAFRDILRDHLYALQFRQLQQSVFVSPYPFEKQLLELVDLYGAGRHVRVVTATELDNAQKLKEAFFPKTGHVKK